LCCYSQSDERHPARRAIRAVGAKLFVSAALQPDINLIEQLFAKLKTLLRKVNR